jgi:hypothetical protein
MTKTMYLMETTMDMDQKTSESTPKMLVSVRATACVPWKHSCIAYRGLVPMSPYTMPSEPRASQSVAGERRELDP